MKTKARESEREPKNLQSAFSSPLLSWYLKNRRDLPWRKTKDPYAILVSEVMLQQTQVKTVIPYYERWMKTFPSIRSLAIASEKEVLKFWEGLGYYRRARFLHQAAQTIVSDFKGKFPTTIEKIATLPGVGPYTLGAVASIAFNYPQPIVDGNVARVLSRFFGIEEELTRKEVQARLWRTAEDLIPKGHAGDFNQAMMELGALVCTPRNPRCLTCPIQKKCWAAQQSAQDKLPKLPKRASLVHQREYAGLVLQKGKLWLYQRPKGGRMENLWQFPSVVIENKKDPSQLWKKEFGSFEKSRKLTSITYSVTHHRIRLDLAALDGFFPQKRSNMKWVSVKDAQKLAFTSAHRKLLKSFLTDSNKQA